MKRNDFDVQISKIKDERVAISTTMILEMLPDYFFEIPASSSGLHHPGFALGEGGLVRHTKVALRILEEIFRDEAFGVFSDYEKDLMRMALLLHDGFKSGVEYSGHTAFEHPILISDFILKNQDKLFISPEDAVFVASLVRSHMGPWNKDKKGNEVLPVPKTREELIIHLCDYIASRSFLDVTFKDNEIVDNVERPKTLSLTNNEKDTSN